MRRFVCYVSFATALLSSLPDALFAQTALPLKNAKFVDIFTSGKEGYHTFRIPALITTKKGTLLAFCEGRKTGRGDHGNLDMVLKRSRDNGKTWGPIELVHEEGGDEKITIGNPCPVVDHSTGDIWLPFCRDNDDVFMMHSHDDGKSWSKPANITKSVKRPEWGWYATGPGVGIQLTRGKYKGRLVIPCDHRVGEGRDKWNTQGHSHTIYSDDHGKTWQLGKATGQSMNECQVAELSDGRLMLNMRSYRGKKQRAVSISEDGGVTWTKPKDNPTLVESVCQASLLRYSFADGKKTRSRLLFTNPATPSGRHHMTVRLSEDEGQTWPVSRLIYAGSAAYSCLTVLPNGEVGLIFERDNYSKLSFLRFSIDDLKN
jgi:sialidase-1